MKESQPLLISSGLTNVVVSIYLALLVALLLAEFGVPWLAWLRATNQVLLLLALMFLPFLLLAAAQMVRSVSLKMSGQELHLELSDLRRTVIHDLRQVETAVTGQISTAEQALWPMLAGRDPNRDQRWQENRIIIGSKLDPSQVFLGYFLAVYLERHIAGLECVLRAPNGGSLKNFADLTNGWIDLYVDYTGTSCQYFSLEYSGKSPVQLVAELNEFGRGLGIRWCSLLGVSDGYCLVVRKELAQLEGLTSIRDLARVSHRLILAADPEFLNRRDGYVGLRTAYDLEFRKIETCSVTNRYALLSNDEADVFVGNESDPELRSPTLHILTDSEQFFPGYHAVTLAQQDAVDRVRGLAAALNDLTGAVTTADLVDITHKLQRRGSQPALVRELAVQLVNKRWPKREST